MKNPDLAYRTLCRLLSSPADTTLTSTLGPDDWHLLAATAQREGVAPLLYNTLNAGGRLADVPPDIQADLRQAYYATIAVNLLLYHELSRILTVLSPLPVVILKGAALAANLYSSIGLRPMSDLDLLVPEEHLAEAVACLKAMGYVQPYPDMAAGFNAQFGHHVHLQGGQDVHLAVELHWTLIGGEQDWRSPSLPWFWQQTEALTLSPLRPPPPLPTLGEGKGGWGVGERALTLTPTAHLLYLCAHLMLQHGEAHSPLRWFYDIHLLVRREGQRIRWDQVVARAKEFRWAAAVHAALKGACDRFCGSSAGESDTWLPPGVLKSLAEVSDFQANRLVARRSDSLQTRATGVVAAASSLSPRARLRLLLAIAIPSPAYVRWRYKPRPSWLWPLCYPYRWLDILLLFLLSPQSFGFPPFINAPF
jgi:hypothetical protein